MDIGVTPIDGINEKLIRSRENILNLEGEIARLFEENEHPIIGNESLDELMEKAEYLSRLRIPLRLAVLAGEVLHHYRSSLDHMAWLLAKPGCREKAPTRIEFPVFRERFSKDGTPSLKGKIEIFASDTAKQVIERVQPYNGPDPLNDELWLIHDLDRKAKHRELPLVATAFDLGSPELNALGNFYGTHPIKPIPFDIARQISQRMKFAPIILYAGFTKGEAQPLIPALRSLEEEVRYILNQLLGELAKC